MTTRHALPLLLAFLVGCGGEPLPPPPTPPGLDDDDDDDDDDVLGPEVWAPQEDVPDPGEELAIGPMAIDAGTEATFCLYGSFEDEADLAVNYYSFHQHPTLGHHLNFYLHNQDDAPADGEVVPCDIGEMNAGEVIFEGNVRHTDESGGAMVLDEGMAVHIPAGSRYFIESHYVNYTDKDLIFNDYVYLGFADHDAIHTWVSSFVHPEGDLAIPPNQISDVVIDCEWQQDILVKSLIGHMHWYGKSHSVDWIHVGDGSTERIYELPEWDPEWRYAPVLAEWDGGLVIAEGDRFVTTCTYDNPTAETIGFPEEMCVTAGTVWGSMFPINCERF